MKEKDVEVGSCYMTRIGNTKALVKVVERVEREATKFSRAKTRFRCVRLLGGGKTRPLDKLRPASGLHLPQQRKVNPQVRPAPELPPPPVENAPDPVPSNCGMDPSAPVERPQQPMTTGVTELTAEQAQRLAPDSRVAEPLVE